MSDPRFPSEEPCCGRCRFAAEFYRESASVQCRRRAPTWIADIGSWPDVRSTDWCGEFEPRTLESVEPLGLG